MKVTCYKRHLQHQGRRGQDDAAVNLAYLAAQSTVTGRCYGTWTRRPQPLTVPVRARVKGGGKGLISGTRTIGEAIKGTDFDNLDLLPGDFTYRNMDLLLDDAKGRRAGFPGCSPR